MIFTQLEIEGLFLIELEPIEDDRGFFSRTFCQNEFSKNGLSYEIAQCNTSFNKKRGTIRGMHFQTPPKTEVKLVSCVSGGIYDVALDLRGASDTYLKWISVELNAENRKSLYLPEGVAHGFQALADNTEVVYQMFEFYEPECQSGVLFNDELFGIKWPIKNSIVSEKDFSYPAFTHKSNPFI